MTSAEYRARYAAARAEVARMSLAARKAVADVYLRAADEAAAVVEDALERGLSSLTVDRWEVIARRLVDAAKAVATGTEQEARNLITKAASVYPSVDSEYLLSAARAAGVTKVVTTAGARAMVAGVEERVIKSLTTRLWTDGYKFSDRVWKLRGSWLDDIKSTVAAGIAQGRDPVKIARDIQVYTRDGKVALVGRWGRLERGTAEFSRRIPKGIDWRAARLVRTELYSSLQESSVMSGEMNPGTDGTFDWVLSGHREPWPCECEALADGGPYPADQVPIYPHPQCMCQVRPHLRDHEQFIRDLKEWQKGVKIDYLDRWYTDVYQAAA